jgi:uncharacterized protein (DUF983 family)
MQRSGLARIVSASRAERFCREQAMQPISAKPAAPQPDAWLFFKRAMKLRCPECGEHAVFKPLREVASLSEWFNPVKGCPKCGYDYVRENGYFLISIWAINYGVIGGLGLAAGFIVDEIWHPPAWKVIVFLFLPLPLLNFLFVRHSKSLFLAMDHYFDPHVK